MKRFALLLFLIPGILAAQAVSGDPLLKGNADIANAEVDASAAIASSKLATDVLVQADIGVGLILNGTAIDTKSDEQGFLEDAVLLTCGSNTEGQIAIINAGAILNYCDDAGTPIQHYIALGASDGDALAGDTADSFFDAGTVEAARGGTNVDSSGFTGVMTVTSGTWINTTASTDLLALWSDETGTGVSVFSINPTLTDVIVDDLLTFAESAGDATCAGGDYWIKGNSSATTLRGCENGALFTLSAGGTNPLSLASPESLTVSAGGALTLTGAADTLTYHTILGDGASDDDWASVTCTAGSKHIVSAENATQTITIQLSGGSDFLMDNVLDRAEMLCHATDSLEFLSRANNGT